MPVPVSITHMPTGRGVDVAKPTTMLTEGPFARLARQSDAQEPQKPAPTSVAAQCQGEAPAAPTNGADNGAIQYSIDVQHLNFSYPGMDGRPVPGQPPLITDMCLRLEPGSCCLLLGANGAGKTTLLKVLAGKHMVPRGQVAVLGRPPFHDTELTTSGQLAFIGGAWTRDIAFAGTSVPLTGDFPARRMLDAVPGADAERRARLMRVLDIDPDWRMHTVSDGQRRRVQLAVGLLRPFSVLLLDEVTVDLDVLGRADLMAFLADEARQRGAAIVYATHIFDGLEGWPTHVAYVARGRLQFCKPAKELPALAEGRLLEMVQTLLIKERDAGAAAGPVKPHEYDPALDTGVGAFSYAFNNGWVPGTLNTSLKDASNAVMRM